MSGQRIIFVNRFYAPDHSATSQILTDLARHLAGRGWEVQVVASRLLYGTDEVLPPCERLEGVEVVRVATTRFGNTKLAGRALDYLSFYVSAFLTMMKLVRRGDMLVAKTDPPLISVVAAWVAALKGARLVNWLQDLYPEIAFAYGVKALQGPVGALLTWLRNGSLKAARINVAICGDMAGLVVPLAGGAPVDVIHNWSDDTAVAPLAKAENALRRDWDLMDRFVVGYSGNLGRAHDWRTIVDAADALRGRDDICFLMIGGGAGLVALKAEVDRRGLAGSFRFEPYQPKALLRQSLALPDVHLVTLLPEFRGLLFPSKLFGIAAAGRGVIAVTEQPSELAEIVRASGCGEAASVGDGARLAATILALEADPSRVEASGRRAREMLEAGYLAEQALARWSALLEREAGSESSERSSAP